MYQITELSINSAVTAITQLRRTIPESMLSKLRRYVIDEKACIPEGVSNESLKLLLDSSWLNCDIMNYYMLLLQRRFGGQTFYSNSFAPGSSSSQKRKPALDDVLIPLNVRETHWILLHVRVAEEVINVYDSAQRGEAYYENSKDIMRVKKYLVHYGKQQNCWKIVVQKSEQQKDGDSCGVFTLMNAKALRLGVSLPQLNGSIMDCRSKILCEIMIGQILDMMY
jgi:Ulp1 family protease